MPVLIKTVKIVLALLLAYALYLLICSTLAYLPDKTVSAESRENLDAVEFYGNGAGPDRVALLELSLIHILSCGIRRNNSALAVASLFAATCW